MAKPILDVETIRAAVKYLRTHGAPAFTSDRYVMAKIDDPPGAPWRHKHLFDPFLRQTPPRDYDYTEAPVPVALCHHPDRHAPGCDCASLCPWEEDD